MSESHTHSGRPIQNPDGGPSAASQCREWAAFSTSEVLRATNAQLNTICDALPQMIWCALPNGDREYQNRRWYDFTGVDPASTDKNDWRHLIHPDDQCRALARWHRNLKTGEAYEIEYRLCHRNGRHRWVRSHVCPVRDSELQILRWFGTCTDINETKMAAEQNALVRRELVHRIKNVFAVVQSLIRSSVRADPSCGKFAVELWKRIDALARVHESFLFLKNDATKSSFLDLLTHLFEPYHVLGEGRIRIKGDDFALCAQAATPIALLFHELTTNAIKYGALSNAWGRVTIEVSIDPEKTAIRWSERGGPHIAGEPRENGFGIKLTETSIARQLGGTLQRIWNSDGLEVRVEIASARLNSP